MTTCNSLTWRKPISKQQRQAIKRIADMEVNPKNKRTYKQLRKESWVSFGTLVVPWCNMFLAVEPDGYIHS